MSDAKFTGRCRVGTPVGIRAYAASGPDESSVEVQHNEMTFFTHRVNGQTYGGWYRHLAPCELEIMGAGFLCKTSYAGCDELSVARSVLEDFLRSQLQVGAKPSSLDQSDNAG